MRKVFSRPLCLALVLPVLLLAGCSDIDEMKSKRQLITAEALLQEGNEAQAEQTLNDLLARYPATQSAGSARSHLQRLQVKREMRERQAFGAILDSYQQVLNGYRALYSQYPASLATLDASDYFFDSSYLEEIIPEGYRVYLWLNENGSGYQAWCVANESPRGYAIDAQGSRLIPFESDKVLEKIAVRFSADHGEGKLVALKLRD